MVLLQNTAEGGVAGQAVTTGNSGGASGDAFVLVSGGMTYAASPARGAVSIQGTGGSGSAVGLAIAGRAVATRFYLRLASTPTAAGLCHVLYTNNTTTFAGRLLVNTSRQIGVQNAASGTAATLTAHALALDTWYRVEVQVAVGATTSNGQFAVQVFVGDSTSAVATYSSTTFNAGTTAVYRADSGRVSGTGWGTGPFFDDIAVQDAATAIGPYRAFTGPATLTGSGALAATGSASSAVVDVPAASGGDDQTMLAGILANATAGQTIRFPAGSTYRHSGKLALTGASKANISIEGNGAQLIATTPSAASLGVFDGADNVSITNLRHTVQGATTRINQGFDVAPFVFSNVTLGALTDLTSEGSAGLGFYFWKAQGGSLLRLTSKTSLADGIHFTAGSGGFAATDCQSLDAGDDGFAHIGYLADGAETGRPHDIVLVRPYVRDSRARGISYAGARDCSATDVNIDGSLAANVYFAVERGDFNTGQTDRCTVTRGRLARAGTSYAAIPNGSNGTGLDQGAVLWLSSGTGAAVTDCKLADVNIGQLAAVNYDTLRAIQYGGTFSGCAATGIDLYAGAPATFVGGNTPASINPAASTDRRAQTLPAYSSSTQVDRGVESIPNLTAWYRGDGIAPTTAGSAVETWADRSGNGYTATNAATGSRPTYSSTSFPSADFLGDQQRQLLSGASASLTAETIFAVIRPDATNAFRTIRGSSELGASGGLQFRILNDKLNWTKQGVTEVVSSSATISTTALTITSGSYSSSQALLYINGTQDGALSNPPTPTAGRTTRIGAGYDGNENFDGQIFEIISFARVLTANERATVHSYLSDRYGVAVADYVPPAQDYTGAATLTGSGTLAATGAASTSGTAALTGAGSLTVTGSASASGTATLTGSGTLSATGAPATASAAALTGSGSLTATGIPGATQTAALTGTGALAATGTAAQNGTATASLTGSGTLTATGTPRYTQVVVLTGTGTLSATAKASTTGAAGLTGTGTLTATGAIGSSSPANLSGSGVLTAATAAELTAAAELTGIGQLTAVRAGAVYNQLLGPVAATFATDGATTAAYPHDGATTAAFTSDAATTATFTTNGIGAGHFAY